MNEKSYEFHASTMANTINSAVNKSRELVGSSLMDHEYSVPKNMVSVPDALKLRILDSLIDTAMDVYGPNAGIFLKSTTAQSTGFMDLVKSRDGNLYLNTLNMISPVANALMMLVKQQTDYVAGELDNTSRDGTTSLAMVSSCISKILTSNKMLGKYDIPSSIHNAFVGIIIEAGSALIESKKVDIYDRDTKMFTKKGRKFLMDTIKTTVNGNPIFIEPFEKLIDAAQDQGMDIGDIHLLQPLERIGHRKLEMELVSGLTTYPMGLNAEGLRPSKDKNALTIYIDGMPPSGIAEKLYIRCLYHFLGETIWKMKERTEISSLSLIFTRLPDYLRNLLEDFDTAGYIEAPELVNVPTKQRGVRLPFSVGTIDDTSSARESFEDIMSVVPGAVVSLKNFSENIDSVLKPLMAKIKSNGEVDDVAFELEKALNMHDTKRISLASCSNPPLEYRVLSGFLFGVTLDSATHLNKIINQSDITYSSVDAPTGDITSEPILLKYSSSVNDKSTLDFNILAYSTLNILSTTSSTGYQSSHVYHSQTTVDRLKELRSSLIKRKNEVKDTRAAVGSLTRRIRALNSGSVLPIIYSRSIDETTESISIYHDAVGVFTSSVINGVLSGGNTTIIKYSDELRVLAKKLLEQFLDRSDISDHKAVDYIIKFDTLLDSVIQGYLLSYMHLIRNHNEVETALRIIHVSDLDRSLVSYNINTGKASDSILEAARTTRDVFVSSLSICADIYNIKRANIRTREDMATHMNCTKQISVSQQDISLLEYYKNHIKTKED